MKKTLVLGLARSGLAAVGLVASNGADVIAVDENPDFSVPDALSGIRTVLGEADASILDEAGMMVISPGVPLGHPLVAEAESRGIEVISELELAFRHAEAPVIAVTGTNGKSTTVSMIGAILERSGREVIVAGNVGIPFSSVAEDIGPDGFFVIEVSSFQLEAVKDFHPVSAGILNLTPDHLDRYSDVEDYYSIKKRIAMNCGETDNFFYNADDARCADAARSFPGSKSPFSSSRRTSGGVFLDGDRIVRTGPDDETGPVMKISQLGVVGLHNIENALASIAALSGLGISSTACREGLAGFRGLRHRMERVAVIGGVTFYNDSKATNVEAAVKSIAGLTGPIVLIAGGYDKGSDYSGLDAVSGLVRKVVTIGKAAPLIEDAIEGKMEYERASSMDDAVGRSAEIAEEGDLVVLSPACASFDMFRDFEHRGDEFIRCVRNLEKRAG